MKVFGSKESAFWIRSCLGWPSFHKSKINSFYPHLCGNKTEEERRQVRGAEGGGGGGRVAYQRAWAAAYVWPKNGTLS